MKKISLIALFFVANVYGQQSDCDENGNPLLKMANDLSLPNCLQSKFLDPAKNENDTTAICGDCKSRFQSRTDKSIGELSKSEKQAKFIEAAFDEYKKHLTENLVESLKLRSLRPTGSKFAKSIEACKMKLSENFIEGCNSKTAVELLKKNNFLKDFNGSIQNELAKMLSDRAGFNPSNALLKRNQPACFIPEKDLLFLAVSATEEAISPELIKALGALDPKKFSSLDEMLMEDSVMAAYPGEISELIDSLKSHPLISQNFNSPTDIVSFFKSVKDPKALQNLKDQIYSQKHGDEFDAQLATKCNDSFSNLKSAICSDKFEAGSLALNPFVNYRKLFNSELKSDEQELANTEDLEKKNTEILKLCEPESKTNTAQLSEVNKLITKNINPLYTEPSFQEYKTFKHEKDFSQVNDSLCQNRSRTCTENTIACKLLKKYQDYLTPNSLESRLANSSNKEVNELLRSMIGGSTSKLDIKTKEILIAQGIIPKDDGSMVKQPDIPERQPEYYAKEQPQQPKPNQQQANANIGKFNPVTGKSNASNTNGRIPASDTTIDEGYSNVGTKSLAQGPDFSDLMEDQQELRSIQDEIKRRLLGTPDKPTEAEARKVVRDSFKSRKQRLSPEMEDAFTNRIMESNSPSTPQAFANNTQDAPTTTDNRAQVSGGDSAQAKWRKQQDQNALMGMAGAQQALGKESSNTTTNAEAKPKDLTKVALNLADDPRVNLSELFNKKIDQNDSETQLLKVLLRNKNNFLLQIKSMNFKVIFDEKQNFNVLLESGDQQEAARIRPQLEMFLKKLKT